MDAQNWNMIVSNINKMHRRLGSLEEDQEFIEEYARKRGEQIKDAGIRFREEITELEEKVLELRKSLKNITIEMNQVIDQLKDSVKQEELDRVSQRVDEWDPESLATKEELVELAQDCLE